MKNCLQRSFPDLNSLSLELQKLFNLVVKCWASLLLALILAAKALFVKLSKFLYNVNTEKIDELIDVDSFSINLLEAGGLFQRT